MTTRDSIVKNAKKIFTKESLEGLSMRRLAADTGIALSVIYHYFPSKDALLKELFKEISQDLKGKQDNLLQFKSGRSVLKQRIEFIFEHAADFIFLLKYYAAYRSSFRKNPQGYMPEILYASIYEAVIQGVESKEFVSRNVIQDSKLLSHMIYGLIQEYYPQIPSGVDREQMTTRITNTALKLLSQ